MTFATQIATLFLVLAVARAQEEPTRLYNFESDKTNDVTGKAEELTKKAEDLGSSVMRKGAGFLSRRTDAAWLEDKIEAEKLWEQSRKESFVTADEDNDGALKSGDEVIGALMQHLTTKGSGNELFDAKKWLVPCKEEAACATALFERVDMNRDGKVSKKEYNDYIYDSIADDKLAVQKRANRKVLRSLQSADTDKDGIVSDEEFKQFFNEMDFALEKAKTQPTYEGFDEDKDGKVTTKEFSRQLLKLVGHGQTKGVTKDELFETGKHALNFVASFVEEGKRARAGFWNAYALKRKGSEKQEAASSGGKVN